MLTDHYLKAVAFFWLLGTLTTTHRGCARSPGRWSSVRFRWRSTGVSNYLSGDVLSTGVRGFTRIAGYMGGSGLTGNPNDLALMLNLIIPIAGALVCDHHARATARRGGGAATACCASRPWS